MNEFLPQTNTNQHELAVRKPFLTFKSKWADRANIGKSIGWHTARHTFAVK